MKIHTPRALDHPRRRVRSLLCFAALTSLLVPGFAGAGELSSSHTPDCGPAGPPPVTASWLEVASEHASAELSEPVVHVVLENRGRFEARVVLTANLEHGDAASRHAFATLSLAAGERHVEPLQLLTSTQPGASERTGSASVDAEWLSEDGEHSGRSSSPVLSFFPRREGLSVFGDAERRARLRSGGDIPEARLVAEDVEEPGTELEMAFDERGISRPDAVITDETPALEAEKRALSGNHTTHSSSEMNR